MSDDWSDECADFKNVKALVETGKALLCRINGREYWVPKSQITDDSEVYGKGDYGTLVVTQWWADQAGVA